jgi:hypothetical protein
MLPVGTKHDKITVYEMSSHERIDPRAAEVAIVAFRLVCGAKHGGCPDFT